MKQAALCLLVFLNTFIMALCGCIRLQTAENPNEGASHYEAAVTAAPERDEAAERTALIESFFAAFSENDPNRIYQFYAPAVREEKAFMLDENSREEHPGILALKSVEVVKIEELDEPFFFDLDKDVIKQFVDMGKEYYRGYEVTVKQETYPSPFYEDGEWTHQLILVREEGVWYIARTWVESGTLS